MKKNKKTQIISNCKIIKNKIRFRFRRVAVTLVGIHMGCSSPNYKTNIFGGHQNGTDHIDDLVLQAWNVADLDVVDIVKKKLPRTTPDIPTILKHSEETPKKVADYMVLTGSSKILNLIRLTPTNIAKCATIAIINCNILINTEEELMNCFKNVFYHSIVPLISLPEFRKDIDEIEDTVRKEVDHLYNNMYTIKTVQDLYDTIHKNYSQLIKPTESPDTFCKHILYNQQYMKRVAEYCLTRLESKVIEYAQHENYAFIKQQKRKERTTNFFIGPPGVGKSTILALKADQADLHYDVEWNNQVKLNTDMYRGLVIDRRLATKNIELEHLLNYEEAAYIALLSKQLYDCKIDQNIAPDILIDAAYLSSRELEKGLKNEGRVKINIITAPVQKCIARAYVRGKLDQRYVTTR